MDKELDALVNDPAMIEAEPNYKRRMNKARLQLETGAVTEPPAIEEVVEDTPEEAEEATAAEPEATNDDDTEDDTDS